MRAVAGMAIILWGKARSGSDRLTLSVGAAQRLRRHLELGRAQIEAHPGRHGGSVRTLRIEKRPGQTSSSGVNADIQRSSAISSRGRSLKPSVSS